MLEDTRDDDSLNRFVDLALQELHTVNIKIRYLPGSPHLEQTD